MSALVNTKVPQKVQEKGILSWVTFDALKALALHAMSHESHLPCMLLDFKLFSCNFTFMNLTMNPWMQHINPLFPQCYSSGQSLNSILLFIVSDLEFLSLLKASAMAVCMFDNLGSCKMWAGGNQGTTVGPHVLAYYFSAWTCIICQHAFKQSLRLRSWWKRQYSFWIHFQKTGQEGSKGRSILLMSFGEKFFK